MKLEVGQIWQYRPNNVWIELVVARFWKDKDGTVRIAWENPRPGTSQPAQRWPADLLSNDWGWKCVGMERRGERYEWVNCPECGDGFFCTDHYLCEECR